MNAVIVWIDLEMTGLEPETCTIIEIASLITDSELNILAEGPNLAIWQPEDVLAAMDQWNQRTHRESGLIDRVRASEYTLEDAERLTLEFIQPWANARSAPLAGNSIHQDRRFLAKYMPKLENYLHYRIIDVSSVKELAARWYPEEFRDRPRKTDDHMALADIRASVEELQYYRKAVFKTPEEY